MPRTNRIAPGGMVFHVLNRGVGRMNLFRKAADYAAFEELMAEVLVKEPMRICAYCLMPNHWHLVLWPERDGELAAFMRRLTLTHAARWQRHRRCIGHGHVYQGRFKSFPVGDDDHFYHVVRYVERNALRAGLVGDAAAWRWSSLWRRRHGTPEQQSLLSGWPLRIPKLWPEFVNQIQNEAELQALRRSVVRGSPYGEPRWIERTAKKLGLESTLRSRGRPRK